jgi:hypothetical protein
MQTSLLLSFVIKLVTLGREGVLRTTTKHMHTIYEEAWQVDAWASTIDCPQRRSEHWRASIDSPVACFMHDGRFWRWKILK